MSAMEKVAWTEVVVSVAAVITVAVLYPWLGHRATGGFGLLGLLALSVVFVRRRGERVVVDERDREIERRSAKIGVETAWMTLFIALIAVTMWSSYSRADAVATRLLYWLIWAQFAICYGVKGLAAIVLYRRRGCAA